MTQKRRTNRFFSALGGLLGAVLLIGIVYVAASVLHSPELGEGAPAQTAAPVTPMQAGASGDAAALCGLFGAPLPVLPGYAMNGQAENLTRDGRTVRRVTLFYDGFTVTAVRPAEAAPMLLVPGLSVSSRADLTLFGCPAMLASRDKAYCLYYSDETAAYAIYAPDADEESFLLLLGKLKQQK